MNDFIRDLKLLFIGWGATLIGYCVALIPLMQFIALMVGIFVSISTLVIHFEKLKKIYFNKNNNETPD